MNNQEIIDGLERIRFFNQRAGRELWNDKDKNVQDIDIQSADKILSEAIKALEQQDRIIQILDDYDLEAWEILEKIKEVVKE